MNLNDSLYTVDKDVDLIIKNELKRQRESLNMIASENFVSYAMLQAQGSILTNKYAEGYPGNRYYSGCQYADSIEKLAIERAKDLFKSDYVNVQPHSGAQANSASFASVLNIKEKILGLDLEHGGHLTHGSKVNFSGRIYTSISYKVNKTTCLINMDEVRNIAIKEKPKLIVAGYSAYPRILDFQAFRSIANEINAFLLTDMAHFSGLVASGLYPSPVPFSDIVTSTTHKTLAGPRSGFILAKHYLSKTIDKNVFPGQQGGPFMHTIAAKAIAFKLAKSLKFKQYLEHALTGAKVLSEIFSSSKTMKSMNISVLTGGTDIHFLLLDLRKSHINGRDAEYRLNKIGINVNRNLIPFDQRSSMQTSGIRIGTSALAMRGLQVEHFSQVASIIIDAFSMKFSISSLKNRVKKITEEITLY